MSSSPVPLARKWRPKTFNSMVGQDLAVRLVKNSLYKNQLFPVYLLSGQRGCGKTTMGRVFAAAINCDKLSDFQQQPRDVTLPCLECVSCQATASGQHPDFIEIDAASHTGVDNVRSLAEAASFLPVLGRKKIYLIDEAHMLSKAAFNAFLKILEEPPHTALFMLATTDPHKIIDTVKSRCFQLFFDPLPSDVLVPYIASICEQEEILFEREALAIVVREAQGSVRDALNIIERVRIAHAQISLTAVEKTLGTVSEAQALELLSVIVLHDYTRVLSMIADFWRQGYAPVIVWRIFLEQLRLGLWVVHKVPREDSSQQGVQKIFSKISASQLMACLEIVYKHEGQFLKSTAQQQAFEYICMKIMSVFAGVIDGNDVPRNEHQKMPGSHARGNVVHNSSTQKDASGMARHDDVLKKKENPLFHDTWTTFIYEIEQLADPILLSVFRQGTCISHDGARVVIQFSKTLSFFKETLDQLQHVWRPVFVRVFGEGVVAVTLFDAEERASRERSVVRAAQPMPLNVSAPQRLPVQAKRQSPMLQTRKQEETLDITNSEKWKNAAMMLRFFPGTIQEDTESKV